MGKNSGAGMGAAQGIFSVGHIPMGGGRERYPDKSHQAKLRALALYAAEHGLFLKVGPLLYKMDDAAGFFKRLGEVASEESGGFARKFIHERYISLAQTRHYVRKGYPRKPMWVSVKQKAVLFGKAHKENDDGDDAGS